MSRRVDHYFSPQAGDTALCGYPVRGTWDTEPCGLLEMAHTKFSLRGYDAVELSSGSMCYRWRRATDEPNRWINPANGWRTTGNYVTAFVKRWLARPTTQRVFDHTLVVEQ